MVKRFHPERQKLTETSFLSCVMRFLSPHIGFLKMFLKLILICIFQAFIFFSCLWFLLEVCKF